MSNLIELLTNSEINIKNNKKIKSSQNFIMQLLKELKPKEAINLLKNLNLSKEEIKEIISKLPEKEKQIYLKNLENIKKTNTNNNSLLKPDLSIKKDKENLKIEKKINLKIQSPKSNKINNNKEIKIKNSLENNLKIQNLLNLNSNKNNKPINKLENNTIKLINKPNIKNQISNIKEQISEILTKIDNQNKNIKDINNLLKIQNLTKKNQIDKQIDKNNKKTNNELNTKIEEIIINLILNEHKDIPSDIKNKIVNVKKQISKIIKEEIMANYEKNKNLFTKKVITEIKNTSNFKELITIANKNGLNIKKIITTIVKKETKSILQKQNFTNISKVNLKKIQIDNKIKNSVHIQKKDILETILNKKTDNNTKTIQTNIVENEKENKDEIKESNNLLKPTITHTQIKHKIINAKESIKHFSNNLKEAIENYKPPVSKLSIELNPKELGKVEVTIIHRGDNLQININSNNQTINFFHTHQSELKNALVNMGYNGIDMNFNSNQNRENQEKKAFKQYSSNKKEENYDELVIEIPYTYA
jgi:flagellar hook-length control protein FliK